MLHIEQRWDSCSDVWCSSAFYTVGVINLVAAYILHNELHLRCWGLLGIKFIMVCVRKRCNLDSIAKCNIKACFYCPWKYSYLFSLCLFFFPSLPLCSIWRPDSSHLEIHSTVAYTSANCRLQCKQSTSCCNWTNCTAISSDTGFMIRLNVKFTHNLKITWFQDCQR